MNQNSKNLSLKVLTEGFFKTRARRPVIWDVRRIENVEVPAEGGPCDRGTAQTLPKMESEQSSSDSIYSIWKLAA